MKSSSGVQGTKITNRTYAKLNSRTNQILTFNFFISTVKFAGGKENMKI